MQNTLFQEIKRTNYFLPHLIVSIVFAAIGIALSFKIGLPTIESHLDYASFIIALGTLTLFSFSLKGNVFGKIRDESARIGFMFLIVMTFHMVFNDLGENGYGKGHVMIAPCISLISYLLAFVIKVYINPFVEGK